MATKLKLIEITSQPWDNRWTTLKDILAEKRIPFEFEVKTSSVEKLKGDLQDLLKSDADVCRFGYELLPFVSSHLPNTTMDLNTSWPVAYLVKEGGKWWPKSLYEEAFSRNLTLEIGQVDLNSAALVIGAGGPAKLMITSLIKMGFAVVNIADQDEQKGMETVEKLANRFFDIQFNYIPTRSLTTLPGIHSIVVNTGPLDEKDDLYAELYFFNFLKAGGVVIDLTLVPSKTPLIIEAEKWGAKFLEGDKISTEQDILMVEQSLNLKLDPETYRKNLRAKVDAVPFDPSPYLKRFQERSL